MGEQWAGGPSLPSVSSVPRVPSGPHQAAVWGSPIAHSLSPVLHRAAYDALELADWTYDRTEIDEDHFAAALAELPQEHVGLSLTMPLKELALAAATTADDTAQATGAANTLVRAGQGWHAVNTDPIGIVGALAEVGCVAPTSAVIVGSGATARSALWALHSLGVQDVSFMVRARVRPETLDLARRLGVVASVVGMGHWRRCDVVISTVPPDAVVRLDRLHEATAGREAPPTLLDVVYGGGQTPLESAAFVRGWALARGVHMLLHQAAAQVALMTGREAPVEAMRAALERALADVSSSGGVAQPPVESGRPEPVRERIE